MGRWDSRWAQLLGLASIVAAAALASMLWSPPIELVRVVGSRYLRAPSDLAVDRSGRIFLAEAEPSCSVITIDPDDTLHLLSSSSTCAERIAVAQFPSERARALYVVGRDRGLFHVDAEAGTWTRLTAPETGPPSALWAPSVMELYEIDPRLDFFYSAEDAGLFEVRSGGPYSQSIDIVGSTHWLALLTEGGREIRMLLMEPPQRSMVIEVPSTFGVGKRLALTSIGHLFVVDSSGTKLAVFDLDGSLLRTITTGELAAERIVAIASSRRLVYLVLDGLEGRIAVFRDARSLASLLLLRGNYRGWPDDPEPQSWQR